MCPPRYRWVGSAQRVEVHAVKRALKQHGRDVALARTRYRLRSEPLIATGPASPLSEVHREWTCRCTNLSLAAHNVEAMTNPHGPNTVILTYFINAAQLHEMRAHLPLPLFIPDNEPAVDPNRGWLATMSRLVSTVAVHSDADGERILVEFEDDRPGREFNLDDTVEVHMIWPGRELVEALRNQ